MSEFEQRMSTIRHSAVATFEQIDVDKGVILNSGDATMFRLMGIEPNQVSAGKLKAGWEGYQRKWAEKSSTWNTKV